MDPGPDQQENQIVEPARTHGREQPPKCKTSQPKPKQDPVKGEKTEKSKRSGRHEAADLGGLQRIKIEVLDLRADQGAFPEGSVEKDFQMTSMQAGKVDKMKVETGLSSGGNDEEGNQSQGNRAVPKKAYNHQDEKEIEPVEKLPVIGVLHLPHSPKLFGKKRNRRILRDDRHTGHAGRLSEIGQLPLRSKAKNRLALNFSSGQAMGKMSSA